MKHSIAIIILAHHNAIQLSRLINHLSNDFELYVQIDSKSNIEIEDMPKSRHVHYSKAIKTFWGHLSLADTMYKALERAYKGRHEYYMFISGDDLPIKSNYLMKKIIKKNINKNFFYANKMPISSLGLNGGTDRLERYWFMGMSNRFLVKAICRVTLPIQRLIHIKRKPYFKDNYIGSQWVNLNYEAVEYVLSFLKEHPKFWRSLKYSRAVDEIWIQTIIMNTEKELPVIQYDLRYIDWESGPEFPRILKLEDLVSITSSDALFARKVDQRKAPELADALFELTTQKKANAHQDIGSKL